MNTTAKVIVGFVIGAAFGAVTGLLMAPSTGRTARKNLNKKAKKFVKRIEGLVQKDVKGKAVRSASHSKNGKAPATVK